MLFQKQGYFKILTLQELTRPGWSAGGTVLYIAVNLAYQNQKDLNLHKHNLKSTFIETTNS